VTTVPLTIYDSEGNRTVIGTCDVKEGKGAWEISGQIIDDHYADLVRGGSFDNTDHYSFGYSEDPLTAHEAVYIPPPVIPAGRAQFKGTIPHAIWLDEIKEERMTIEYEDFVRKPFIVKAVEVTEENIREIADELGRMKFDENDGTPYIAVEKGKVPNVSRVQLGWWMTKHGKRTHCYAPGVFEKQFVENTPAIQEWVDDLNSDEFEDDETEVPATV
jgi:hypothetical protein